MDLLTRAAGSRAHVLVAEAPGAFRQRIALERALVAMGWCRAESVADADVLAVVGEHDEDFAAVVEHVWSQMSEPRVRFQLRAETEAEVLLGEARKQLRDGAGCGTGSEVRRGFTPAAEAMAQMHDGSGHQHDHSGMMPDGIALAEGAEDRDGLEMDVLHVPLGPVLAHWPSGVVLRVTLQGDVVVDAEVERLATSSPALRTDDSVVRAAYLLDAASSVLALAGLRVDSARARVLRDRCLDGDLASGLVVARLGDRVGRQPVLRWALGGLTMKDRHGEPETLHHRLTALFERARAELDGDALPHQEQALQALPTLIRGMELAAVRLWLAALLPDLTGLELSGVADD